MYHFLTFNVIFELKKIIRSNLYIFKNYRIIFCTFSLIFNIVYNLSLCRFGLSFLKYAVVYLLLPVSWFPVNFFFG